MTWIDPLNALTEMTLVMVVRGEDCSAQNPTHLRPRVLRCPKCWNQRRKARHHQPKDQGSVKAFVLQRLLLDFGVRMEDGDVRAGGVGRSNDLGLDSIV